MAVKTTSIRHFLARGLRAATTALLATFILAACAPEPESLADYRFDNGWWFDGEAFEPRTAYVVDGNLRFDLQGPDATAVIDLEGGFVVPPFCEGHNHNIGGAGEGVEEIVQAYLDDGVFYAMMPGSFALYRERIADLLGGPNSVDVAFANNGLTGPGGHPRGLRESLMERFGLYPEFTPETLPDKGYFEADSLEEVREKWPLILAEEPDFIKVMLYFSEEFEQRRDDPDAYGRRGLNPDFLPEVVRMAHDANKRVAVHVESDVDMATALRAGADIIAHMPSNDAPVRLTEETIRLAAETQASIVTTLTVARRFEDRDPDRYAATLDAQRWNLRVLHEAGANLVIGSDNSFDTSRGEATHIAELGVLNEAAVLQMWTANCARMVFPDRMVGRLDDGYEASFLVLEGSPLDDFQNTGQIRLRVKEGNIISAN